MLFIVFFNILFIFVPLKVLLIMYDSEITRAVYDSFAERIDRAKGKLKRPLTLTEKILYAHLYPQQQLAAFRRGEDYVDFAPDRVALQDATAQMALLQFMNAGRDRVAVPATIHCDHLIIAGKGASADLSEATTTNREVYDFLRAVANRYGLGFWKPGAGIIHQVVLENYAFPGGMMIGTDSHTPTAGGLGMVAIGVGGADAVDVMAGMAWELKMPRVIGVKLTGKLNGWTSPKDVILHLAGLLTVKGATNAVLEYFGEGAASVSATGKATICNMGAELGATTSVFPFDANMAAYLEATGRGEVAAAARDLAAYLTADDEVIAAPETYYDKVVEIDLSKLEPYLNGPFTPDAAHPVSQMRSEIVKNGWPQQMEVGLVGSCTNSSYEDLARAASVARQAKVKGLEVKAEYIINPGSEQVLATATRDGIIADLEAIGAKVMANACGPCIGQWNRGLTDNTRPNSIVTSFNRNFAKRADGNPNTHAFVASPEMVTALAIAGDLGFNPLTDTLTNKEGKAVKLDPPSGDALPPRGMAAADDGYVAPAVSGAPEVQVDPASDRLQLLKPFAAWDGKDFTGMGLLIKAQGKCTTDHISMAGPWLKYRGHLENISENLLMGAVNAFNGKTNSVLDTLDGKYETVSTVAKAWKAAGPGSIVVAEENYGEGSSREHAALEPRFLGVRAVLVKSFARIHETNLKKQGILAFTFADKADYDRIREDDRLDVTGLNDFAPGRNLTVMLHHANGTKESFEAVHTYNPQQIAWFRAGAALNIK